MKIKMCARTSVIAYEVLIEFQRWCGNMAIIHLQFIQTSNQTRRWTES